MGLGYRRSFALDAGTRDIRDWVVQATSAADRDVRIEAFGQLVTRFQDMAYGYAYSILGDFHLAEDAAQEAFIDAYRCLASLREPAAFPGWFRRIVLKHCDRLTRGGRLPTVPLDHAATTAGREPEPAAEAENREMRAKVLDAIRCLPENERAVTTLFYINGYSQRDISDFLEVPVTTVKNRLNASRQRLRERMITMVADELKRHPLSPEFPQHIRRLLELPRPLDIEKHPVRELWGAFRSCFADAEVVELDEICPSSASLLDPTMTRFVYRVDEIRILRPELTSQLLAHWVGTGGGARTLITCGRVFRADHHPTETRLSVFHQCELFSAREERVELADLDALVKEAAAALLPGLEFLPDGPCAYPPVSEGRYYGSPWRGRELHMAGGGVFNDECVRKGNLAPERCGAMGFAFGLERTAQIRHDLDDVRTLWQPPYVLTK